MGTGTKLLFAVLGIVLVVALLSTNLVVAADRTVLDSDFVKDTADEEGLYAALAQEVQEDAMQTLSTSGNALPADELEDGVREAVIEAEIREQGEKNVDRLYAFLHGETDELHLEIDLERANQNVLTELEEEMTGLDLGEADFPQGDEIEAMAESEEQFAQYRDEFREEQKEELQGGGDREVPAEELDQRMDAIRLDLYTERDELLEQERYGDGLDADLEEPAHALLTARVDALTGEMGYDEYVTEVESAKEEFETELVAGVESELADGAQIDLTEGMDDDATESLEMGQAVVSTASLLAIVLPLVCLGIVGLMAWVAPPSTTALSAGVVSTLVGTTGIVGSHVAGEQIELLFAGGETPPAMADFVLGIASGTLAALTVQSVVLLVVGIGLVAVGVAIRQGLLLE
ncbi:hypothetical protein [Natronobacterium gregoryi]|uniref:Uncharacterized protein n=2 Tax=Natronobacterium gregoryi TaxID=44930 RepID=L0AIN9_NATGS|nr:hypothetical protein [Natronobacterium gregoryi]AFZ72935.1 hypothetical protein Natgr_1739 [Natronobacterium gregoryi SP2]ELY69917.1 hypothetical protein C490_07199 [Natronobacterium gregoryi SP2]PLK21839.1 hypothetical protein CYV19_01705 [Natronobacterium gregoryi SP2]SFI67906.1 hypothetical protein SAMN05443661_103105 [Natronobacterium gregoryi]